jgi:hypothetical protein
VPLPLKLVHHTAALPHHLFPIHLWCRLAGIPHHRRRPAAMGELLSAPLFPLRWATSPSGWANPKQDAGFGPYAQRTLPILHPIKLD